MRMARRSGIELVLESFWLVQKKDKLEFAVRFQFWANEAEYEALLQGLRLVEKVGAKCLLIKLNSQLVIE